MRICEHTRQSAVIGCECRQWLHGLRLAIAFFAAGIFEFGVAFGGWISSEGQPRLSSLAIGLLLSGIGLIGLWLETRTS